MSLERTLHLGFARLRVAREECLCGHDHPIAAIAALAGLFKDERTLQGTGPLRRSEAFDRRDSALADGADRIHARASLHAVDEHTASAALRLPAPEFGAAQLQVVAQNIEQGGGGLDSDRASCAVNPQREYCRHGYRCAIVCKVIAVTPPDILTRRSGWLEQAMFQIGIFLRQKGAKVVAFRECGTRTKRGEPPIDFGQMFPVSAKTQIGHPHEHRHYR